MREHRRAVTRTRCFGTLRACAASLWLLLAGLPAPAQTGAPAAAPAAAAAAPDRIARRTWQVDFEQGEAALRAQGVEVERPAAASALAIDCSQARHGRCALRTEVPTEPDYRSHGAYRAEAHTLRAPALRYCDGNHFIYRLSLWVEEGLLAAAPDMLTSLWQFKRTQGPPDLFIGVRGDRLLLRLGERDSRVLLERLERGIWLDLQLEVVWSDQADGRVRLQLQDDTGRLRADVAIDGPTLRPRQPGHGYLKWGQYKPNWLDAPGSRSVVWFDDLSVDVLKEC